MARFVVQNCIYPYIFYMGSLFLQQPYCSTLNINGLTCYSNESKQVPQLQL